MKKEFVDDRLVAHQASKIRIEFSTQTVLP